MVKVTESDLADKGLQYVIGMTTWHENESIEDIVDFLWWHTCYESFESERLAVVQIGVDEALESAIRKGLSYHQKREAE